MAEPTPEELVAEYIRADEHYREVRRSIRDRRRQTRLDFKMAQYDYQKAPHRGFVDGIYDSRPTSPEIEAKWSTAWNARQSAAQAASRETREASRTRKRALEAVLANPTARDMLAKQLAAQSLAARTYLAERFAQALRSE